MAISNRSLRERGKAFQGGLLRTGASPVFTKEGFITYARAGYSWLPEEQSLRFISYASSYYRSASELPFAPASAPEKASEEILVFTALKPGNGHLKLYLARPWETLPADSTVRAVVVTHL